MDPVGIGIGQLRTDLLQELKQYKPAIVRGNASEIIALASLWGIEANARESSRPRGVDTTDTVEAARDAAVAPRSFHRGAVAGSGKKDLVTDGKKVVLRRWSDLMEKLRASVVPRGRCFGCVCYGNRFVYCSVGGGGSLQCCRPRAAKVADAPASSSRRHLLMSFIA